LVHDVNGHIPPPDRGQSSSLGNSDRDWFNQGVVHDDQGKYASMMRPSNATMRLSG
jgi:hypothetical protein